MPVSCPACQTENRDAAKFCHGCARKLPSFSPTDPLLAGAVHSRRPMSRPMPASHRGTTSDANAPRSFWLALGAVMLAAFVGFGGWFGYVTRKPPSAAQLEGPAATGPLPMAPPVATVPVPVDAPQVLQRAPPDAPQRSAEAAADVPLSASLGKGEAEVAVDPPVAAMPGAAAAPTAPPPAAVARRTPPAPVPPARSAALDPRRGCENLNFFSAARCEAAHCDQAAYARHPRCDAVREDRRRDEARRNPMLGT
ncbi:hypothetical protein QTH87_05670 [Variovorax sp. J22P168]|uniref:hypothetical protein n=1 Tax=Variovorax jilinensis TaxID=3053513 RepID=UPI00257664C0|nr:hypothetical protein [Variovorax sp. J22P168]MDM0011925.1 hypothetical protein [Variovorax sp. J22P168]